MKYAKEYLIGRIQKLVFLLLSFVLVIGIFMYPVSVAKANPQGPNVLNISSSGRNAANLDPITMVAKAGNVTGIVIDGTKVTESWQGYYGNITGTITLDDADNYTLYDWSLPNPEGEIYASNGSSVDWNLIYCINVSQEGSNPEKPDGTVTGINGTQIELLFGINNTDKDGLDETFNDTYINDTGFRVGATTLSTTDGCSMAHPYVNGLSSEDWKELLLSDNTSIIFTSIIKNDHNGFQDGSGDLFDFQMIVLENGHYGSEDETSNYYFYVELA